jgi:Flp pilus assembly CpaE family ATPase
LEVVLSLARRLAEVTVVDVGFCLESDEELAYDTLAPRRNGATLEVLATADEVIAVGSADPVGLQRLVRGLASLREAVPDAEVRVVVNRLRGSAIPGDAAAQVRQSLLRHAGVEVDVFVPLDVEGFDRAVVAGRPLGEVAPQSPARRALAALAASCAGVRTGSRRRGLLARR